MKYLYKAMENLGDTSGNVVLGWHEKVSRGVWVGFGLRLGPVKEEDPRDPRVDGLICVLTRIPLLCPRPSRTHAPTPQLTEVAGIGCIVRVMSDRRRV